MDINVNNISKSYGKQKVLSDISFSVSGGQTVGIVGANGCGKTTLLSILAGIEMPDSGSVVFSEPGGRSLCGYLPQINPLLEEASVYDNLRLWTETAKSCDELIDKYGFSDIRKKKVSKLSGGMKRRLAIACALCNDPKLLIMDEPTASLDIDNKKMIHDRMRDFISGQGAIILVTHELEEIKMCSICYKIQDGTISKYELPKDKGETANE